MMLDLSPGIKSSESLADHGEDTTAVILGQESLCQVELT